MSNNNPSEEESNKRAALAGQWRTPPLPVFPTNGTMPTQRDIAGLPPASRLPSNTEDYEKALQEAYRRGAEAAAKMAMSSAVSCPDFQGNNRTTSSSIHLAPEELSSAPILPPPVPNPLTIEEQTSDMPPPPPAPHTNASAAARSMSLPDMASYAAKQEEDKRQKRLARNRASARLRRLRKKNLVRKKQSTHTKVVVVKDPVGSLGSANF